MVVKSFKSKGSHVHAIPSFMYKRVSHLIAPAVSELINLSFREGKFPEIFKQARVIPIHKSGSRNDVSKYRPISTIKFVSKVFEKIMYKRVSKYCEKYSIITNNQFGFRKGRCTVDAVLKFTDQVYDTFNSGKYLISVLLDFSKAFDTVQHGILLRKLDYMGIRGRNSGGSTRICPTEPNMFM
jgi:hypothetical protein